MNQSLHISTGMGRRIYRGLRALLLVLLLGGPCLAATAAQLQPGQAAPEFQLPDLDGSKHSLAQLRKQGYVLLLFWSVNCHFCHQLIPEFRQLHQQYDGKGLTLVAVNVGYESGDDIAAYARDNALPYLILNDDEGKEDIIEQYALIGTPTFVLVAPDGRIASVSYQIPALPAPRVIPEAEPPAPAEPAEATDAVENED